MCHIPICGLFCSKYLSTLSHKQDCREKSNFFLNFLRNLCLKHFSFQEEMSEISKLCIGLHVKYSLYLSGFNEPWILSTYFRKYKTSLKSVQRKPSCSKRTDGRTGVTTLIVSFRNFEKAPKIYLHHNVEKPSKEILEGCTKLRGCMLEQILPFTGK
jgi:hypothetical protein